jgi:tripartite-type tricarboxylate transporter receptor subunit TctC
MSKRNFIFVFAFALLAWSSVESLAQGVRFPAKDMMIVCGSKPGAPIDVFARQMASRLEKDLGKPVVVQNKTGGTQAESLSTLLSKPADGHTMATVSPTTVSVLANTLRKQFKPEDFIWLVQVQAEPYAMVVRAESPFQNMKDLMAFAKANPGKVKFGGYGTGSSHHLAYLEMIDLAGVSMSWVPFEGGAEALTQALGGHIDVSHTTPSLALGHVQAKRARVLGITDTDRLEIMPDVGTFREQGIDQVLYQWRGLAAKAGTPKPIQEKLLEAILKVTRDPGFVAYMKSAQQQPGKFSGEAFHKYALQEFEIAKKRMTQLGMIK